MGRVGLPGLSGGNEAGHPRQVLPVSGTSKHRLAKAVLSCNALSCVHSQGFSTLIANLITSSSDYDVANLDMIDKAWVEEYLTGYGQEIYCLELSSTFVGKLFCVAINLCFSEFGVCLFAIETRKESGTAARDLDDHEPAETQILINPKDYTVRSGDRGFFIADDKDKASAVTTWNGMFVNAPSTLMQISPADKRTFLRLNAGHGPFLRDAKLRVSGHQVTDESKHAAPLDLPAERPLGRSPSPAAPPVEEESVIPVVRPRRPGASHNNILVWWVRV